MKSSKLVRFKARIFNALSDPVRIEIIEFLRGGEKCVCEIVPHVNLIQPAISRHLKILRDCGLVKDRKEANWRFYSITDKRILEMIDALDSSLADALSRRIIEQIA